jgi:hypothetical protein
MELAVAVGAEEDRVLKLIENLLLVLGARVDIAKVECFQ